MLKLRKPYLLFIGDAQTEALAKTALGLFHWARESCLAQLRFPDAPVRLELPEMTPEEAAAAGAGSLVIGVAPVGGSAAPAWEPFLFRAVEAGLDIVSGMHAPLACIHGLPGAAQRKGVELVDVRQPRRHFPPATGRRRSGKRLLTVGTDCALGKKYTALALTAALRERGVDADFRATGQTGIMIAGGGIAIDAVVADFAASAAELLSPDADPEHWDVIEGQGSLFHPAYSGVSLSLLHGSQPDVLVLCHDPSRRHLHAFPDCAVPDLELAARWHVAAARLTNPAARLAGVSLNTSSLDAGERERILLEAGTRLGVPSFDPMRTPADEIVARILEG